MKATGPQINQAARWPVHFRHAPPSSSEINRPKQYEPLVDYLKAKGYHYLDYMEPLVKMHSSDLSIPTIYPENHFPAGINKEMAGEIIKALHL